MDADPLVVLLASPLLGPAVWAPVGERMAARGYDVLVPDLPDQVRHPDDVLTSWLDQVPPDREIVLVPHSNAGLYVAALAASRSVRAVVFVDAGLPGADGSTRTAPPDFRAFLAGLADDEGVLPPWTGWWPDDDTAALFPDAATRARVAAQERRLPLGYFDASVPSPGGWETVPCGYVGFGATYDEELAVARARAWPVVVVPGEHLHQLVDPAGVAEALVGLLARLGVERDIP